MSDGPKPPLGRPIDGVTTLGDVNWALQRANLFLKKGGDRRNPAYVEYVDDWLDYRLAIAGTHLGEITERRADRLKATA